MEFDLNKVPIDILKIIKSKYDYLNSCKKYDKVMKEINKIKVFKDICYTCGNDCDEIWLSYYEKFSGYDACVHCKLTLDEPHLWH